MNARLRTTAVSTALAVAAAALLLVPAAFAETSTEPSPEAGTGQGACQKPKPPQGEGDGQQRPPRPTEGQRSEPAQGEDGDAPKCAKPKPPKVSKRQVAQQARMAIEDELGEDGDVSFGKVSCSRGAKARFTCRVRGELTAFADDSDESTADEPGFEDTSGDGAAEDDVQFGKFRAMVKIRVVPGEDGPDFKTRVRITFVS